MSDVEVEVEPVLGPPFPDQQAQVGTLKNVTINVINPVTGAIIRTFTMDVINAPPSRLIVNGLHGSVTYNLTVSDRILNVYFEGVNNWTSVL